MDENRELNEQIRKLREENRTLFAEIEERRMEIQQLNVELEETNKGVVVLYAELDDKALALRKASELKSRFLSYISHEFRTPLGSIRSLARIVLDGPVIHLSATFVKDVDKVQGLEAGADGYLTHPIEPPVLIATVNAFLRTREAEKEWHRSEGEFKAVFENALNGIFLISRDLAFVKANPAMCRLLQQPHDKIVGRPILDFVPHDRRAEAGEIFKRLEQDKAWRGVFALERADGHAVHLESNLSDYSVSDIWLAVVSDISGRLEIEREREELLVSERAARTEAERANRLKDDFLATLSHELRTPLNAIVGWSQLLKIGGLDEKESAEGIESIERNAKIQAQMIADLLDVSRITSGKLRLDLQPIDPAATVEAAVGAVLPAAGVKEIEVIKIFDPDVGLVSGDAGRLQQVVWNLINNAVKFTPKGGRIEIRLARNDSQAVLSVTDNGQGIGPDVLPYIFDRFRQGDATSTRGQSGLGLGLASAKQLVEMHGGTIRAESPGEGKGATFVVALPLAPVRKGTDLPAVRPGPRLRAGAGTIDAPVQLEGIRVLVVDDDADSRRLTKRVLADYGAQLMDAENVTQALQVIDDFNPHVLISDLGMPTEDGFDLIRHVRARGYTFHDLPAVALTAFARMEDRRRALLAGFQVHLTKPVDATELSAVIATLVGRTGRDL